MSPLTVRHCTVITASAVSPAGSSSLLTSPENVERSRYTSRPGATPTRMSPETVRVSARPPHAASIQTSPLAVFAVTSSSTRRTRTSPDAVATCAARALARCTSPEAVLTSASSVISSAVTSPLAVAAVSEASSPVQLRSADAVLISQDDPVAEVDGDALQQPLLVGKAASRGDGNGDGVGRGRRDVDAAGRDADGCGDRLAGGELPGGHGVRFPSGGGWRAAGVDQLLAKP